MLRLVLLLQLALAVTVIHVGVVEHKTGKSKSIWLERCEGIFREYLDSINNTLAGYKVNIVFHHADGGSDKVRMSQIAPAMANGTWVDEYWTTKDGHAEPPMHACDLIWVHSGSAQMGMFLGALKAANIRIPVYASGSSSNSAWQFQNKTGKYDFVVQGHSLGSEQVMQCLKFISEKGAKTMVLAKELNPDGWTKGNIESIKRYAKANGIAIIAEGFVPYKNCGSETDDVLKTACNKAINNAMDSIFAKTTVLNQNYTADIYIGMKNHRYGCPEEATYLHNNKINFKGIIMHLCSIKAKPINAPDYIYDYMWSGIGWHSSVGGDMYNERDFGVEGHPRLFQAGGKNSPKMFEEFFRQKFDIEVYRFGWPMTSIYFFWRDFAQADGIVANMINSFDKRRYPMPSFYGFLGSEHPGGWNIYHKYLASQQFPDAAYVVAPTDIATKDAIWPTPMWHQRWCYPRCTICPKCDTLSNAYWYIALFLLLPAAIQIVGVLLLTLFSKRSFDYINTIVWLVFIMMLVFNLYSDIATIIIIFFQIEVNLISSNQIFIVYLYSSFALLGLLFKIFAVYLYQKMAILLVKKTDINKLIITEILTEYQILILTVLSDAPILCIQIYTYFWGAPSDALVISMCFTCMEVSRATVALKIAQLNIEIFDLKGYRVVFKRLQFRARKMSISMRTSIRTSVRLIKKS